MLNIKLKKHMIYLPWFFNICRESQNIWTQNDAVVYLSSAIAIEDATGLVVGGERITTLIYAGYQILVILASSEQ